MEKIEGLGNVPAARFGHTVSFVAKGKAILFGGATGDTGRFSITGDAYSFDMATRAWKRLQTTGTQPAPRAAHAAATLDINQVAIYGGSTGGGSLASDELYILDLRGSDDTGLWVTIPVIGQTPGRRYGHSLSYTKPYLVVFGGNTGKEAENDCWFLKADKSPFSWTKIIIPTGNNKPSARVYHSASVCNSGISSGMVIVFGGRAGTGSQDALDDSWGLCRHRDGRWDWVKAPYNKNQIQPTGRYQHTTNFVGKLLVVAGGRSNQPNQQLGIEVYDTENSGWSRFQAPQRFRHCSWTVDNLLMIYGGFEIGSPTTPVETVLSINLIQLFASNNQVANQGNARANPDLQAKLVNFLATNTPSLSTLEDASFSTQQPSVKPSSSVSGQSPNSSFVSNSLSPTNFNQQQQQQQQQLSPHLQSISDRVYSETGSILSVQNNNNNVNNLNNSINSSIIQSRPGSSFLPSAPSNPQPIPAANTIARKPPSNQFQFLEPLQANEQYDQRGNRSAQGNRNINNNNNTPFRGQQQKQFQNNQIGSNNPNAIHNKFINQLLQPKYYINLPEDAEFPFSINDILTLCEEAEEIIKNQPIVLKVRPPLKIFGDIHGQYSDLMRFFDLWGNPSDDQKQGDIDSFDYLFLGDYVDRGSHSLETICLLLALKIRYPKQIHLLRGNHEDRWINNGFGFSFECSQRLGEDPDDENSVFCRMNNLFEWMPLAAIIENKIICLHGGIGCSLNSIADIETIHRPLQIVHEVFSAEDQLVVDILWSDPTDSDQELGIHPNIPRDPARTGNIVKFGPDRVSQFLQQNNLSMIIRAHECVMDGFERFAAGKLITVFSATDYSGKHKNAGAVLILRNNLEITPKLIYPSESTTLNHRNWIEDDEELKKRPLTPPRWANNDKMRKSFD